jgi:sortase (surface protein transpeptidase)
MQPSEIENMDYYEYWYYVKNLSDHLKQQQKQNKEQEEQYAGASKNTTQHHKMPKTPNLKVPNIKVPKL